MKAFCSTILGLVVRIHLKPIPSVFDTGLVWPRLLTYLPPSELHSQKMLFKSLAGTIAIKIWGAN